MKALQTVGVGKAFRYLLGKACCAVLWCLPLPPLRVLALRLFGASIGPDTIIEDVRFINFYRGSFRNFRVGRECFIGQDCMFDLAAPITVGDQVTLAQRVVVLTHLNVGYPDHPLQAEFPARTAGVTIEDEAFVGASCTILCGTTIHRGSFLCAGAVAGKDVAPHTLAGGVPAREIRALAGKEADHE